MADKVSTKIDVDSIQDDIRLLFQHLVLAAGEDRDVASIFKCKLSSFLSSLFDFFEPTGLFRAAFTSQNLLMQFGTLLNVRICRYQTITMDT
jgi:hypothetical protein